MNFFITIGSEAPCVARGPEVGHPWSRSVSWSRSWSRSGFSNVSVLIINYYYYIKKAAQALFYSQTVILLQSLTGLKTGENPHLCKRLVNGFLYFILISGLIYMNLIAVDGGKTPTGNPGDEIKQVHEEVLRQTEALASADCARKFMVVYFRCW